MSKISVYNPQEFWEKRLSENFSFVGIGYACLGEEYNKWLYKARIRVLNEMIRKNNISCKGKKVLELGVGNGFYVDYWKGLGISDLVGIDITSKSVDELTKRYPEYSFKKDDISSPDLISDDKFDIITVFDVLYHVLDEKKFDQIIENIKKVSHKESVVLIMDDFIKKSSKNSFHVKIRTLDRYVKEFEKNGMVKKEVKPLFYFMSKPTDNKNKLLYILHLFLWTFVLGVVALFNKFGKYGRKINHLIGGAIYYIDKIVLKYTDDSPSTKLMLVVKK